MPLNFSLLFPDSHVLFEKLIEQHRVDRVEGQSFRFSLRIVTFDSVSE